MAIINPLYGSMEDMQNKGKSLSQRLADLDSFFTTQAPASGDYNLERQSKAAEYGVMPSNFSNASMGTIDAYGAYRKAITGDINDLYGQMDKANEREKETDPLKTVDALFNLRDKAVKQGRNTDDIDAMLGTYGFGAETTLTKDEETTLSAAKELLGIDTKNITGLVKFGPMYSTDARYADKLYQQIIGKIALAQRKVLSGQGQISDFETKLLMNGSTLLDKGISDKKFKEVLERIVQDIDSKGVTLPEAGGNQTLDQILGGAKAKTNTTNKTSGGFTIEEL